MSETSFPTDPLQFLQMLLRCRSVTPADDGALSVVSDALAGMGFEVHRLDFGPEEAPTPNLYAQLGQGRPSLCLAGHTDVVPPGEGWSDDPFAGVVRDGRIYGRGTADMKGGIACFVAAVARHLKQNSLKGTLSFLITGDEEGPAHFGTKPVLQWMKEQDKIPDFFLLGEPTNPSALGDVVKIGRRGSLNAVITVPGVQGHVAYPHLADNPVHRLISALHELTARCLDEGSEWFAPSSLQVVSVDVGNKATNVIPGEAQARLNIRFNDRHSGESLASWIKEVVARWAPKASVSIAVSGESFLTEPGKAVQQLSASVKDVTGREPKLDTGGGTSDARFMTHYAPVAEFGLVGETMHKCDEHVGVQSLEELTQIYQHFMERFGV
ncbi:succinyl-diaminopimelate desuccinylase [Saccharibacter floricola]|uniref:Succinyl-diaminopimelate desuccinylase n=1 Tax=Saccharibacter floricola DSM 15669 TaxID=1123227 RepID=A0ABQ0NYQ0_9PROT|nr:succinyl-diaminopimelate desuccinylase [Saccharibacter floricola]GBQ06774.1 succinyl-diaminopimelate desuccinylase [Saccharibacter floricola DSM 15669]